MSDLVQANYRLPGALKKAVADRAKELDMDASEFVRQGLQKALVLERGLFEPTGRTRRGKGVSAPRRRSGGSSARAVGTDGAARAEGSSGPTVNLALALSTRTGMPRAVMERRLREGRVSINGEVVRAERAPLATSDVLALDGEAV